MSVCPKCNGRKYIESDKIGLVTAECDECKGAGVVEDTPTAITIEEEEAGPIEMPTTINEASEIVQNACGRHPEFPNGKDYVNEVRYHNDNNTGVEPDNQPFGKPDPGEPTVSKKSKTRKKTRKKSR